MAFGLPCLYQFRVIDTGTVVHNRRCYSPCKMELLNARCRCLSFRHNRLCFSPCKMELLNARCLYLSFREVTLVGGVRGATSVTDEFRLAKVKPRGQTTSRGAGFSKFSVTKRSVYS